MKSYFYDFPGVDKCTFFEILKITFNYLLEIISPIVGWCLIGTFTNPFLKATTKRTAQRLWDAGRQRQDMRRLRHGLRDATCWRKPGWFGRIGETTHFFCKDSSLALIRLFQGKLRTPWFLAPLPTNVPFNQLWETWIPIPSGRRGKSTMNVDDVTIEKGVLQ